MIFQSAVFCRNILHPGFFSNILHNCQFFGSAVDQMKVDLREKDSQRYTREPAAGACIKDFRPGPEIDDFGNTQ